jgi:hypothetical protein
MWIAYIKRGFISKNLKVMAKASSGLKTGLCNKDVS